MSVEVAIIGEGGVGKSALTIQFVQNQFVEEYDPTIEDSYRKALTVDGRCYVLDLVDTAGQEEYSSMRGQYMRGAEAFVLVYSVTSRSSFQSIEVFREQIYRAKDEEDAPLILVGNKCDLRGERQVSTQEGEEKAKVWGCPFVETSAKNRVNVDECFSSLMRQVRKMEEKQMPDKKKKKKKGACSIL